MYNGILAVKQNTSESVLVRQMNVDPVLQSEVSQKEKNKYRILTHTHIWNLENGTVNLFAGQKQRCRHREWNLDTAGEGEDGMN